MSEKPKAKKREPKKKDEAPPATGERKKVTWAAPQGSIPKAMVSARHDGEHIVRAGRGFSAGEIAQIGLSPRLARRWGVMLDSLRGSTLEPNVSALKKWFSGAKQVEVSVPSKPEPKKRTKAKAD